MSEKVSKIEWSPKWSGGAPMPQVFSDGEKVYLTYIVADWDEEMVDHKHLEAGKEKERVLALVEFDGSTFRFGIANDEVFPGLAVYEQGISWAQIIENSNWIEEIKQIHKVHPYYDENRWKDLNHYLLTFKDEILEVIAGSYQIEVFKTSYNALRQEVISRMND